MIVLGHTMGKESLKMWSKILEKKAATENTEDSLKGSDREGYNFEKKDDNAYPPISIILGTIHITILDCDRRRTVFKQ